VSERAAVVKIDGKEYELLLTTRATKEIGKRYGDLEKLGDQLMTDENIGGALEEIVWLITLLANQPIAIYNLRHNDAPKPYLTAEEVELLTSPLELTEYRDAIASCIMKGTARHIESEPDAGDSKNAPAG
jgi:hypothetical protein